MPSHPPSIDSRPEPAELLHPAIAAEDDFVADLAVPAEQRRVGEHAVAADDTVVGDVAVRP